MRRWMPLAEGAFRALVLTGAGRGFCSGADMNELSARRKEGAGDVLERLFHPLLRRLRDLPMPIVTAVNGPAVGIGMSLALMGDLIVASRTASFLLSFTRIGLVPDGGVTFLCRACRTGAGARDGASGRPSDGRSGSGMGARQLRGGSQPIDGRGHWAWRDGWRMGPPPCR